MKQNAPLQVYDILDYLPLGLFLINEEYKVLFWSKTLEDWSKIKKDEIINKNIFDFYPDLNKKKYTSRLNTLFFGGPPAVFSSQFHKHLIPIELKGGVAQIQNTIVLPIEKLELGEGLMKNNALFVIEDVTDHVRRIQMYREMRDQAFEEIKERVNVEETMAKQISAMETSSDGIIILDEHYHISYANKSFAKMYGFDESSAVQGKLWSCFFPENDWKSFLDVLLNELQNEDGWSGESKGLKINGDTFYQDISLNVIDTGGFVVVVRDINSKKLERFALRAAMEKVEEASKSKDEFLATMSHELRTPLNSILLLSGVLRDNRNGTLTDKESEYANIIHESGKGLLSQINDILDLSKMGANKTSAILEEILFEEMCQFMYSSFFMNAKEKGIEFRMKVDSGIPEKIISDKKILTQILYNLLGNALKFTHHGSIDFNVSILSDLIKEEFSILGANEDFIQFEIKDSGVGIPDEHLEHIFESFRQVDSSIQRRYEGTGLGLAICKKSCQLLGGDVKVESEVGVGSIFTAFIKINLDCDAIRDF